MYRIRLISKIPVVVGLQSLLSAEQALSEYRRHNESGIDCEIVDEHGVTVDVAEVERQL